MAASGAARPHSPRPSWTKLRQCTTQGSTPFAEIAASLHVGRSTLYRSLHAYSEGPDCALIVYRSTRTRKIDPDTNRRYGETGTGERAQLEADRKWFPIAQARWPRLKAVVYVVDGTVASVRAVDPDLSKWDTDDRGYVDVPLTKPLTQTQVARQFPALGLALGDPRPHARGRIREYISI